MLTAMASYQPKAGSLPQIRGGLGSYSDLSRRYDATRQVYWNKATAMLTPQQRAEAEGGNQ